MWAGEYRNLLGAYEDGEGHRIFWGRSSFGRASPLHGEGSKFDSCRLHQPQKNYIMIKVAAGCYFEPEEDEPIDPIVGKKTSMDIPNPIYYRKSELDDVPDDYATRIMKMKKVEKNIPQREVKTPDGFAITIAYNKSGYQVIPKEDLKNFR